MSWRIFHRNNTLINNVLFLLPLPPHSWSNSFLLFHLYPTWFSSLLSCHVSSINKTVALKQTHTLPKSEPCHHPNLRLQSSKNISNIFFLLYIYIYIWTKTFNEYSLQILWGNMMLPSLNTILSHKSTYSFATGSMRVEPFILHLLLWSLHHLK